MENNENNRIRTFEDLEVWRTNRNFTLKITEFVKGLPEEEQNRMGDHLIRTARNVTNCIAEGYGRFEYQENIDFCRQARASIYRIIDSLIALHDINLISEEDLENFKNECNKSISFLNGYIRHLLRKRRQKDEGLLSNKEDNSSQEF